MIDLHIHLLPGVDDGPVDLQEAVELCRLAAEQGCEALIATPHQRHPSWLNTDSDHLRQLLARLAETVGDSPRLALGAEIRVDSGLLDELDDLSGSGLLSLADSRYLLLELDRSGLGPSPESLVHELAVIGWSPIIAHPEFVPALSSSLALLRRLASAGGLFQLTATSLLGGFGKRVRRWCLEAVDAGLAHFVASDAHGVSWRPPQMAEAREELRARWGDETARRLMVDNPRAVLEARELTP
jgi:protein-tyrosine phosphatase